ncbi:ribbon-helix-helix protein, CopG family [Metabacillus sp. FJAT-53654]|uniref:Ribbon-helix-helix protein, CopG family n=1 Tax=Metabacillus rhizosphaerae TaxID=3117747 RepID=A0ABZ2MU69_9BACI
MKELTFRSYDQFQQFIEHKVMEKAVMKGLQDEKLATFKKEFKERANKMWKENDCDHWIEKHGYVVIMVWKDEIGRRKIARGRPKKLESDKFNHSIHVRLDDDAYEKLSQYCREKDIDISEAIRQLIREL